MVVVPWPKRKRKRKQARRDVNVADSRSSQPGEGSAFRFQTSSCCFLNFLFRELTFGARKQGAKRCFSGVVVGAPVSVAVRRFPIIFSFTYRRPEACIFFSCWAFRSWCGRPAIAPTPGKVSCPRLSTLLLRRSYLDALISHTRPTMVFSKGECCFRTRPGTRRPPLLA